MHGYFIIERPKTLTDKQWDNVLAGLFNRWDVTPKADQPAERLHFRRSLDGTKVLVHTVYEPLDTDPADETRMASVAAIASKGKHNARAMAQMFRGKVTVFPGATQAESAAVCREYLVKHAAEWEAPMEALDQRDELSRSDNS